MAARENACATNRWRLHNRIKPALSWQAEERRLDKGVRRDNLVTACNISCATYGVAAFLVAT